jgi:predicted ribosomally synthesized peptide with SipW-like signal peptide
MRKIIISLSVVAAVAAAVVVGTTAFFSDTETSTGNTFTAGTIDISVDNMNPWSKTFTLADMKPSYVDYINFEIQNIGSDPNPVDVWKNIKVTSETTGAQSEPECTEQQGCWDNNAKACDWNSCVGRTDKNDLSSAIWYDLYVEVLNANGAKIWWQTLYLDSDHKTIDEVYGTAGTGEVYLGMIPAGGKMKVKQSYHLAIETTNWAQGDQMKFDIALRAVQIQGTAVLENKTGDPDWKIKGGDTIQGNLSYKVKNPTFDFSFTGKALLTGHNYVLAAGWKANGAGFDVDKKLGSGTTDGNGDITITGVVNTGDMKDVKVWLVPVENWSDTTGMVWAGWPNMVPNILWETGLIWYDDTDL